MLQVEFAENLRRAKLGDAAAQFRTAVAYLTESGVKLSHADVDKWLLQASKKGHAAAKAYCTILGYGQPRNSSMGFKMLQAAAVNDNSAETRYMVLQCLSAGIGTTVNIKEGLRWAHLAAKVGSAASEYYIGTCYESGNNGVELCDVKEAARWFRLAAERGFAYAEVALGNCYRHGTGVAQDFVIAREWYLRAAVQECSHAQAYLGDLYREGLGVVRDLCEAVKWYRLSAEQGYSPAQFSLGCIYEDKDGPFGIDDTEAVKWYDRSAKQGNAYGQGRLADFYREGRGVPKDFKEAMRLYRLAATQGYNCAQTCVGYLYRDGLGVQVNLREAVKWFKLAADQGHANAQFELGKIYGQGAAGVPRDKHKAIELLRAAARDTGCTKEHCTTRAAAIEELANLGVPVDVGDE